MGSELCVDDFPAPRRSLRVALVSETYPPEVNGVAMTVARLVQGLQQRNHDVQLIRPRQPGDDAAAQAAPAHEVRFHELLVRGLPIPRYPELRLGVPSRRALVRLWSLNRPDVVHLATEGPLGWSALQAALQLKLPATSDFRTNFHAYSHHYGVGWLRKPIMAYLRKFHNRTLVTTVPTEPLRRELEAAGFHRLAVVGRGADVAQFSPLKRSAGLRAAWGAEEDDLVVACVGRLAAEKNLELLASTFESLRRTLPRSRLLLVGDGPLRETMARRLPDAVFAGQRRGDDLAAHYASADLFLFPSLTETFGNVTIEAMASGLPVVAFDYAAAAQLIEPGANGVRVPMSDAAAFERAAIELAHDRARRRAYGERARVAASAQGWPAIIERFEGLLMQACRRHEAPTASAAGAASAA